MSWVKIARWFDKHKKVLDKVEYFLITFSVVFSIVALIITSR